MQLREGIEFVTSYGHHASTVDMNAGGIHDQERAKAERSHRSVTNWVNTPRGMAAKVALHAKI
jgi:hypothetical protein